MIRHSQRSTAQAPRSFGRRIAMMAPLVIASSLFTTLGISSPASASHVNTVRQSAVVVHTNTFCTQAENFAKANPAVASSASSASLATNYKNLKALEPKILAIIPAAIKGDYQSLFNYFNGFYAELAGVNYNFSKLSVISLGKLAISSAKVSSAAKAITAYVTKTCGTSFAKLAG